MKRILFLALFLAFNFLQAETRLGSVTKRMDIEEAVRLAHLNNPLLLASLEDIAIARQKLRMARHLRYPQLGFDATATTFNSERSFVISEGLGGVILNPFDHQRLYLGRGTLEQVLYNGGRTRHALVLARESLEQAYRVQEKTRTHVTLNVKSSFVEYLRFDEERAVLERLLADLNQVKPGNSGLSATALLWEDCYLSFEIELETLANKKLPQQRTDILRAIGMDLFSEIKVVGDLKSLVKIKKTPSLTTALSWARELRSEYRTQALMSEMNATQVAIALAGRQPIVSLAAMYESLGSNFPLNTHNWAGLLRMHLPLSWDSWATIREQKAQQRKGQVRRVEIEDQIALEVRKAHAQFVYSQVRFEKERQRFEKWNKSYSQALKSTSSSEGRLDLFKRYAEVQLEWIEAQADILEATYQLEYAVGRSLEE